MRLIGRKGLLELNPSLRCIISCIGAGIAVRGLGIVGRSRSRAVLIFGSDRGLAILRPGIHRCSVAGRRFPRHPAGPVIWSHAGSAAPSRGKATTDGSVQQTYKQRGGRYTQEQEHEEDEGYDDNGRQNPPTPAIPRRIIRITVVVAVAAMRTCQTQPNQGHIWPAPRLADSTH